MALTPRGRFAAAVVTLLLINASAFAWSVWLRSPWFGVFSEHRHQWQSAQSILYARNWLDEGLWQERFLQYDLPRSIERRTREDRWPYVSFPPGAPLALYAVARATGRTPDVPMVMSLNLANHFAFAAMLSVSVLLFVGKRLKIPLGAALLVSLIPVACLYLLPAPLYWLQFVFYADEAVMTPAAAAVLCEVARDVSRTRRWRRVWDVALAVVLFLGVLTDWLAVLLAAGIFIKRVVAAPRREALRRLGREAFAIAAGPAAALGLLAFQIVATGNLERLLRRFVARSGWLGESRQMEGSVTGAFWLGHVQRGFGFDAVWTLWLALGLALGTATWMLVARVRHRRVRPMIVSTAGLGLMVMLPVFVMPIFLRHHSVWHDFAGLKVAIPFAIVPWVVLPVLGLSLAGVRVRRQVRRRPGRAYAGAVVVCVAAGVMLWEPVSRMLCLFVEPTPEIHVLGGFLDRHTGFEDVVFSPDVEVPPYPPQVLSLSMKSVYRLAHHGELGAAVAPLGLPPEARVDVLLVEANWSNRPEELASMTRAAKTVVREDGYVLLKDVTLPVWPRISHP